MKTEPSRDFNHSSFTSFAKALGRLALAAGLSFSASACDLCAINSAANARGEAFKSFVFTVAEQYISAHNLQFESKPISVIDPEFLDSSITHIIPGYNFTPKLGLSLNIPVVHRSYRLYNLAGAREGRVSGLGDISLIGRYTPFSTESANFSARVNLLAGVKLPSGDARYVRESVEQEVFFDSFFPSDHGHAISGVHLHDLALGSGSVDGVFGVTGQARWKRVFVSGEAQYYLRTKGESDFEFGDTFMLSGGPGMYLFLRDSFTLNLQALTVYDTMGRSKYFGEKFDQSGMTAIYLGPQLGLTWGNYFSAVAGVDLPLEIYNGGLMTVPDYRIHGALVWSF